MMRWRRFLIIVAVVFVGLVSCFFIFRGTLLRWAFAKVQVRVHEKYNAALTVSSIQFSGLSHVVIKDITLLPDGADTFMRVREADVNVSLLPLMRGKVVFDGLQIDGASITVYNEPERNNLNFLRSAKKDTAAAEASVATGYRERAANWEERLFRVLGTAFLARDVQFHYQDTARIESIYVPNFVYTIRELSGVVIDRQRADTMLFTGTVIKKKSEYQCTIQHLGNDSAYLPFLDRERGLKCRFKNISANIKFDNSGSMCSVTADALLKDFHLNHWRLANDDVVLPEAQFKGMLKFTDDAIELDSASVFTLTKTRCRIFARYEVKPDT
ncbi:MAG: glycosyl transferase, partial [Bacteroidetes bacterium]|nr:glycosyl transferase [Bacteroidota bacterium]